MQDYLPSDIDARRIQRFKRAGLTNDRIAEILRLKIEDMEQYYPTQLGFTTEEDLAAVAEVAYELAVSGEDPGMTKWWLTVKGGWIADANNSNTQPVSPMLIMLDPKFEQADEGYVIDGEYQVESK